LRGIQKWVSLPAYELLLGGILTVARRLGDIARKAAGPAGYWFVLGLITFLGMSAVIKIEAIGTRLFFVMVVLDSNSSYRASLRRRIFIAPARPSSADQRWA
jgi:hypothetical protein